MDNIKPVQPINNLNIAVQADGTIQITTPQPDSVLTYQVPDLLSRLGSLTADQATYNQNYQDQIDAINAILGNSDVQNQVANYQAQQAALAAQQAALATEQATLAAQQAF
jgi:hypothetical protein